MISDFNVEVHSNGFTITPLSLGELSNSQVFLDLEEALTEIYRMCSRDWSVGDKVKIEKRITTA